MVENIEKLDEREWLASAYCCLAELHAAMARISFEEADYKFFTVPDMDSRFELFCRLKSFFNDSDSYQIDQEPIEKSLVRGSLADDFTDIYLELKRGLDVLDAGVVNGDQEAVKLWQSGFMLHWGQHIVDAQRHLYKLRVRALYSA